MLRLAALLFLNVFAAASFVQAVAEPPSPANSRAFETLRTDSRTPYVHRLTLYDHDGQAIDPTHPAAPPYSPRITCGKCHDYAAIASGWHFNAGRTENDGRPGEPWILTDPASGTQLPLSRRRWVSPAAHGQQPMLAPPDQLGLEELALTRLFGRHSTGGTVVPSADEGPGSRWAVSGPLEIDCMTCHARAPYDIAEWARQIDAENFRWTATAALGLAVIRGEARKLPDDFDPLAPPSPDHPERALPITVYDRARFDADNRVLFDITRISSAERCYACHTTASAERSAGGAWLHAGDVHIAAGMSCTDCHRHGLDHAIVRGYPAEAAQRGPAVAAFSCAGCHLGDSTPAAPVSTAARAAPFPEHLGIPPIHFERMTCTACHSGPLLQDAAQPLRTARAHGLGIPSREHGPAALPRLVAPVFARTADGIAPHYMIRPAFWARFVDQHPVPLAWKELTAAVTRLRRQLPAASGPNPPLSAPQITALLSRLGGGNQPAAYVRDGQAWTLAPNGDLKSAPVDSAPYLWPLAHDVRPARAAIGARGCWECHSSGAPFFDAPVGGYLTTQPAAPLPPGELMNLDPTLVSTLARTTPNRGIMIALNWVAVSLLGLALLRQLAR